MDGTFSGGSLVYTLSGFDDLAAKLAELPNKITRRVAYTACAKAMAPVRDTAKQLCPVAPDIDHGFPPGALADSLVVHTHQSHGAIHAKVESRKGAFLPGEYYGGYVEYGTAHEPAQPFLRPALDQNHDAVLDLLSQELRKGLTGAIAATVGVE